MNIDLLRFILVELFTTIISINNPYTLGVFQR